MTTIDSTSKAQSVEQTRDQIFQGNVQYAFAYLQLEHASRSKEEAKKYMDQIEGKIEIPPDLIKYARATQALTSGMEKHEGGGEGWTSKLFPDLLNYLKENNLYVPSQEKWGADGYKYLPYKEWIQVCDSLTQYQDKLKAAAAKPDEHTKQALMVHAQEAMGQYNAFTVGAKSTMTETNEAAKRVMR